MPITTELDENANLQVVHAISLDYDGCGDILFPEGQTALVEKAIKIHEQLKNQKDGLNARAQKIAADFLSVLERLTDDDGQKTTLYIGSNRQSKKLEEHNRGINNNGFCKENYTVLAHEKRWNFNPLRVWEDEPQLLEPSQAEPLRMANEAMSSIQNWALCYGLVRLPRELQLKIHFITQQMANMAKNNSGASVQFHFIDDREDILAAIKFYFMCTSPPAGVTLNLYHFNYTRHFLDPVQINKGIKKITEIKPHTANSRPYLTGLLVGGLGALLLAPFRSSMVIELCKQFPTLVMVLGPLVLCALAWKISASLIKDATPSTAKVSLGSGLVAAALLAATGVMFAIGTCGFAPHGINALVNLGPISLGAVLLGLGTCIAFALIAYETVKAWPKTFPDVEPIGEMDFVPLLEPSDSSPPSTECS